jgi:molybdate transport system substrate-binding protein
MQLDLLSGGTAKGLVRALAPVFKAETGYEVAGAFGAVGAMREQFLGGTAADLVILSAGLVADLAAQGHIDPATIRDLGPVRTALAARRGHPTPRVETAGSLRVTLLESDGIYCSDLSRAIAGSHFAKVLAALGVDGMLADRLRPHPSGADAMRGLAAAPEAHAIGCTQLPEILQEPGVALVGALPAEFELVTVYTVAVTRNAKSPELARRFATLLAGTATAAHRRKAGFGV